MDYKKTKIYKIWSTQGDKIYVGSTTKDLLSQRMTQHRSDYTQFKKSNKRRFTKSILLFDEYGIENCFIELIESKECNNKDEKNQLEGYYIRTLNCVNKNRCGVSKEELKESYEAYQKKYREENKETYSINHKEYYQIKKDEVKEKAKEYRINNRELINEKARIQREANPEKFKEAVRKSKEKAKKNKLID
jgi:hypothetical protein